MVIKSLTQLVLSADTLEKAIKILEQNRQPGFPLMKVFIYWIFIIPLEWMGLRISVFGRVGYLEKGNQVSGPRLPASISLGDRPTQLFYI